ncbi:hypothetical protein HY612_05155, partial [Candidatus Roizmanbacteria bacterium]|nr:hypothetical protein [Candidatus Roizmanbacteria bacterium]
MSRQEGFQRRKSGLYQIPHKDGTISFIGDTTSVKENVPFAFRNSSTPLDEEELIGKLQEASLPVKGKPTHILGWGGDSVCFRITDGDTQYAAVLRSNRESENWQDLQTHRDREQDINQAFSPYTIPQNLMVVNGIDNKPAVLKVTREIPGATLSEVSGTYLFMNRKLMD